MFAVDILRLRTTTAAPPPAGITLVSSGSQSKLASGGTTAFTVFASLGIAASSILPGDYIVFGVATGTVTVTQTASWGMSGSTIGTIPKLTSALYANDTKDCNFAVFGMIVPAGGIDTNLSLSGVGTDLLVISGRVYRGVHQTTPQDVALTTATGINTDRPDAPSITTVTAGAKVVAFYGGAQVTTATALVKPANLNNWDGGQSLPSVCYTGDADMAVAGAFDPGAATGGENSASDSWCAVTMALRPA